MTCGFYYLVTSRSYWGEAIVVLLLLQNSNITITITEAIVVLLG